MEFNRGAGVLAAVLMGALGWAAMPVCAQVSRFDSYQLQAVPENANILIGPFYSDFAFFQSVGVRYIKSSGAGMDYLGGGTGTTVPGISGVGGLSTSSSRHGSYGRIKKDGVDFPLVTQLIDRNYLLISQNVSVDFSFGLTFRCFPSGSEDNTFDFELVNVGLTTRLESFNGRNNLDTTSRITEGQSGFSANLSSDFELTPFVRGRVYDRPSYRNDFVDERGYSDSLSGQQYPVFQNMIGLDLDWQMAPDKSLGYSASRTDTMPQNNEYDVSSSVVWRQSLEYRQKLNHTTAAGGLADFTWREYDQNRGSQDQQDYVAFVDSDVTEDSSINASLGYSMVQLSGAGTYETNGTSSEVIGSIGLNTRLSETLSHGISYARSQRGGFLAGAELVDAITYHIRWGQSEGWTVGYATAYESVTPTLGTASAYTDWMNQLTASRPLMRDLDLIMATAYIMRMNTPASAGGLGEGNLFLNNDYDTWTTTAGLLQALTKRLKLYAYVEHLERISSNEQLAGTRDIVGMTLGYYYDF